MPNVTAIHSLEAMRKHVHAALCARDNLDPAEAPLCDSVITRRNRPCGVFFQVQGPRQLRTYAIWAGDEHRILFYDSRGERFAEVHLSESPDPLKLAA